jgi:tetratricopeptide (TPR) repeat protein
VPYLTRALDSPAATREARAAILLDLGSAYSGMGEFDRARQAFADSVSSNETPKGYLNWGLALIRLQRLGDAEEKFRAALRLDPGLAEAHSSLGGIFAMRGDNDAAIAEYREALRLKPSLASAHASLGLALASQGRLDDAIGAFLKAIDLDPNQAEWRYDVAVLFARRGQRDAAIQQLEVALRINPGFERARETLRGLGR